MPENRALQTAGYALALMLVLVPLSEAFLAAIPFRPLATEWRVGSIGILTEALMTFLLGLSIAAGVSLAAGHRATSRALGGLSAGLAVAFVLATGMFVLDSLKTRPGVRAETLTSFDAATIQAVGKLALTVVVLASLAAGLLRDEAEA